MLLNYPDTYKEEFLWKGLLNKQHVERNEAHSRGIEAR